MRTKPQTSLRERLKDPSTLDQQRTSELAVLSLFALVSDPSGRPAKLACMLECLNAAVYSLLLCR